MRLLVIFCLVTASPAYAQSAAVDDWFRFMAETNSGSALESAGSKGSIGTSIGAGVQNQKPAADTTIARDQLRPTGNIESSTSQLGFVTLYKGTPWPVDFGVSVGQTGDRDIKRFGGYAQWSWLQIPRGASAGLRLGHHSTQGYKSSTIQSTQVSSVGSFGYGYVTGYAVAGLVHHQGTLDVARSQLLRLALRDPSATIEKRTWQEPIGAVGLKVRLGTPFLTSTVEWSYAGENYRGISAKLSIGL